MVFAENLSETQSTRYAASLASLKKQLDEAESQLTQARKGLETTKDPAETSRLESRINQYEQIYSNLLVSYEDVRMADAQSSSSVVQVEAATVPSVPIRPNPMRNAILAAAVGFMLAVGGIFAVDALDDTVKSPDELNRQLHLPIMGTIIRYEEPEDGAAYHQCPTPLAHRRILPRPAYQRPVRLRRPAPAHPPRHQPRPFRRQDHHRRQPGHRYLPRRAAGDHRRRRSAPPAYSPCLQYRPAPRAQCPFHQAHRPPQWLLPDHSTDRLHVVAAGELPPNPSELLGSNKMRDILDAILEQSDLVMLDTPPVLSVTDAVVLAPIVDGVLIVVRPGVTKMNALKYAVEQLRYVGANLVGIVLNAVDDKSSRYGYYYKSYYYKQYKYYRTNGKPTKTPAHPTTSTPTETVSDPVETDLN